MEVGWAISADVDLKFSLIPVVLSRSYRTEDGSYGEEGLSDRESSLYQPSQGKRYETYPTGEFTLLLRKSTSLFHSTDFSPPPYSFTRLSTEGSKRWRSQMEEFYSHRRQNLLAPTNDPVRVLLSCLEKKKKKLCRASCTAL